MQIVEQSWSWMKKPDNPLQLIEMAGKICYKSEKTITPESAVKFCKKLLDSGHHSVIEHATASVRFITNRGITHEIVRHRLAAYSQESTRYVNYGSDHITFIRPVWMDYVPIGIYGWEDLDTWPYDTASFIWMRSMMYLEKDYKELLQEGWRPEQAREVLPNALKTEIVMTCNLREWMHVFKLRTSKAAHPQIRALMLSCLDGFQQEVPVLFDGIGG